MIWIIKLSLLFNSSPSKPKSDPKIFPDAPALLQPPPGSSCQAVDLLFAPLLACRVAKGGGTSILVPFNPLPTSCIAFFPLSPLPSHSVCSSKLPPESFQCLLFLSPVCPGSLCVSLSLSWKNSRPHVHCDDGCNEV